jgi:hypothetical protein
VKNKTQSAPAPRIVRLRHIAAAVRRGGRSPGRLAKDFGLTPAQIASVKRIAELKRDRAAKMKAGAAE